MAQACYGMYRLTAPLGCVAIELGFRGKEVAMSTYVLMTKLSPETLGDPRGREAVGREWKAKVDALCPRVKWVAHYALLGPYDFMDIYEAPDDEAALEVSLISRSSGALTAESWPALAYEHYLGVMKRIEG